MKRTKQVFVLLTLVLAVTAAGPAGRDQVRAGEWPVYGGDNANSKYSPLAQIDAGNVRHLQIAWSWTSPDEAVLSANPSLKTFIHEATPLMVDGVLYTATALSQVAAIDPETGRTLWVYDPGTWRNGSPPNFGFVHRGVAYWRHGGDRRILIGTGDAYLIALDARTGQPVPGFGDRGRVDLTRGLRRPIERFQYAVTSPPIVWHDLVIVGSSIWDSPPLLTTPPGDVRAFDVRTGRQMWTFHTVPQEGELGTDTWKDESWRYAGQNNVWTPMSIDEDLGYVYLPVSTAPDDWYGGFRRGDNLFAESLVALDARTGRRVWHYQTVHHGLWDYDLPAAPNLVDLKVRGRTVKAVAQVTKQGFVFAFDRATGEPLWPIEERPVPPSTTPGEEASPTQPFPTRPAPFERQGLGTADLIDFTPALRAEAQQIVDSYDHGPLFTPATERGLIQLPGPLGGANWQGAAFDPETGKLYIPSVTRPYLIQLFQVPPSISEWGYVNGLPMYVDGPQGLPLTKPPYGRITAIDLKTGNHAWVAPLGDGPRDHPLLSGLNLPRLGWPFRGLVLLTKTLLFAGQEGQGVITGVSERENAVQIEQQLVDPKLRAFDKGTGALLWEMPLPGNPTGSPMTYALNGHQYIVVAIGGAGQPAALVALRIP